MAFTPPAITISRASSTETSPDFDRTGSRTAFPNEDFPLSSSVNSSLAHIPLLRKGSHYENLDDLLRKQAVPHMDHSIKDFWPPSILNAIVTRKRILEELVDIQEEHREMKEENIATLADEIHAEFRTIFAILCMCDKGYHITDFVEGSVKDIDLPLVPRIGTTSTDWDLARKNEPDKSLGCVRRLKTRHTREFFACLQHRFVPAYLSIEVDPESGQRNIRHERFEPTLILPFEERVRKDQGGYGMVSRVRIQPHCHGFHNVLKPIKTDDAFALKELIKQPNMEQNQSDREFWQEVDSLKRFSGFIHPHLVTLLMTWTIQNSYYLLFPWADCDLDHFLNRKRVGRDPQTGLMDLSMLQWISKQILGMASALNSIHNPRPGFLSTEGQKYGRHGDLKPENILWYQSDEDSQGILVIADLGLSTLNSILTRSGISNGKIPGTPRYRPPEYDIKGGHISRSYDIWTFGCLLLEIVCWALNGPEGRKAFADRRESCYVTGCVSDMFFGVERHLEGYFVMKVKDQVSQEIADLHNHPSCSEFFHALLYIIEEEMLIVLSKDRNRISAPDLVDAMTVVNDKVLAFGHSYCQTPCRKPREPITYNSVKADLKATVLANAHLSTIATHAGKSDRAATAEQLADRF